MPGIIFKAASRLEDEDGLRYLLALRISTVTIFVMTTAYPEVHRSSQSTETFERNSAQLWRLEETLRKEIDRCQAETQKVQTQVYELKSSLAWWQFFLVATIEMSALVWILSLYKK